MWCVPYKRLCSIREESRGSNNSDARNSSEPAVPADIPTKQKSSALEATKAKANVASVEIEYIGAKQRYRRLKQSILRAKQRKVKPIIWVIHFV